MSEDTNRQHIHRFFAEIDKHNFDALGEICTPDYKVHFPGAPVPLDVAATKGLFAAFHAGFPDLGHRVEDMVAEEDRVAIRLRIHGAHTAEFQGIPATGREMTLIALNIYHFVDGRISEQWVGFDSMSMLQQLGVAPAAPAR